MLDRFHYRNKLVLEMGVPPTLGELETNNQI